MQFSFNHPIFKLHPFQQTIILIINSTLKVFLVITSLFLLFSDFLRLKALGVFLIIISIYHIFRKNSTPHDLRYEVKDKINLNDYLTKKAFWFIVNTFRRGLIIKSTDVQRIFLLFVIKEKEVSSILKRFNVDIKILTKELKQKTSLDKTDYSLKELREIYLTILKDILIRASSLAKAANIPSINLSVFFVSLIQSAHPELKNILLKYNLTFENIYAAFLMENYRHYLTPNSTPWQPLSKFNVLPSKTKLLNKALTMPSTPTLNTYGIDLTYLSRRGKIGFLIGHQEEFNRLLDVISRPVNNKVILVGEDGSGKTSIVWHLAFRIDYEKVPKALLDYRVIHLDLTQFLSGQKEKNKEILNEILRELFNAQMIILIISGLEELNKTEEGKEIISIINPLIQSTVPLIFLTTPSGLSNLETSLNLRNNFEIIQVNPLSKEESLFLITLEALMWEKQYKVIISPLTINKAIEIASDFIRTKPLPKSAEDLILEGISRIKRLGKKILEANDVLDVAETILKIPVKQPLIDEKRILTNLEDLMHQRIVNQEEAIKEIARVLRIYRSGITKKSGPIGVFLFVGPTGVGKTETAKTLSKLYFANSEMLRLDMVEFQNPEDIEKLIGSEDGKILGQLTEPLRQNPYRVILLDEFEKTHSSIMKLFLPIFDEGKIKDSLGREIDFTNTIIICTSNAYSEDIKNLINQGKSFEEIKTILKDKLSQIFSIELLNRFDNIIVFKPLSQNELKKIAQILISDLRKDLETRLTFYLEISETALQKIVEMGTDPIFGARPLKRAIDQTIKDGIAKLILADKIKQGSSVFIDYKDDFQFEVR